MPTKPLESVLYRELSRVQAKEQLILITPLLQELINNGTNVFIRCATSVQGEENEDLAALAVYRHILEMIDGFDVLIVEGCVTPTIPILRSVFEALMSLEYIVESEKDYVFRSLSWLTQYIDKRLALYESMLPSTPRGQQFQAALKNDVSIKDWPEFPSDEILKAKENLDRLLSRPQFLSIKNEISKLSKKTHRKPEWYSLMDGPQNLKDLASYLKRDAQYEVLYRQWSSVAHAYDFSAFIAKSIDGESGIRGIRDTTEIKQVSRFALTFMLAATRLMLKKFRPDENFAEYYISEIQNNFLKATKP